MDSVRTGVFVFCALLAPVSCSDVFFTDPVICYFLDGFLMVYCIAATALFFREKFSKVPPVENVQEDNGGIYQELESPADVEYQVLNIQPPRGRVGRPL
ncbi:CD247 antigen like, partial [Leuresthes tenuis]|uniref:CD247 antigen like n=1 Tax=Leuresthes tenuis TaxID=355514 RepID=UPI003B50E929